MPESRSHMDLVQVTYNYIKQILPNDYSCFVQVDSPDTKRPGIVEDFVPDVYLCTSDLIIIGEAKTIGDFERSHSKAQYRAYLNTCMNFNGTSILVISVPWQVTPSIKNYLRRLKEELNAKTKIVVLNELSMEAVL